MFRSSIFSVMLTMLVISICSIPQPVQAATKNWTGCPISSTHSVYPGPKFGVSWVVSGVNWVIAFQPDYIKLGGGAGSMTLGQLNRWTSILEQLRTAAEKKVKVTIYYIDTTKHVKGVKVRWNKPC